MPDRSNPIQLRALTVGFYDRGTRVLRPPARIPRSGEVRPNRISLIVEEYLATGLAQFVGQERERQLAFRTTDAGRAAGAACAARLRAALDQTYRERQRGVGLFADRGDGRERYENAAQRARNLDSDYTRLLRECPAVLDPLTHEVVALSRDDLRETLERLNDLERATTLTDPAVLVLKGEICALGGEIFGHLETRATATAVLPTREAAHELLHELHAVHQLHAPQRRAAMAEWLLREPNAGLRESLFPGAPAQFDTLLEMIPTDRFEFEHLRTQVLERVRIQEAITAELGITAGPRDADFERMAEVSQERQAFRGEAPSRRLSSDEIEADRTRLLARLHLLDESPRSQRFRDHELYRTPVDLLRSYRVAEIEDLQREAQLVASIAATFADHSRTRAEHFAHFSRGEQCAALTLADLPERRALLATLDPEARAALTAALEGADNPLRLRYTSTARQDPSDSIADRIIALEHVLPVEANDRVAFFLEDLDPNEQHLAFVLLLPLERERVIDELLAAERDTPPEREDELGTTARELLGSLVADFDELALAATHAGPVRQFSNAYRFLHNGWPTPIRFEGETYSSVEHAFQAAQTENAEERRRIRETPSAAEAVRLGTRVTLRPNWSEERQLAHLQNFLDQKFSHQPLAAALAAITGPIENGRRTSDPVWGIDRSTGEGRNELGRMLGALRDRLIERTHHLEPKAPEGPQAQGIDRARIRRRFAEDIVPKHFFGEITATSDHHLVVANARGQYAVIPKESVRESVIGVKMQREGRALPGLPDDQTLAGWQRVGAHVSLGASIGTANGRDTVLGLKLYGEPLSTIANRRTEQRRKAAERLSELDVARRLEEELRDDERDVVERGIRNAQAALRLPTTPHAQRHRDLQASTLVSHPDVNRPRENHAYQEIFNSPGLTYHGITREREITYTGIVVDSGLHYTAVLHDSGCVYPHLATALLVDGRLPAVGEQLAITYAADTSFLQADVRPLGVHDAVRSYLQTHVAYLEERHLQRLHAELSPTALERARERGLPEATIAQLELTPRTFRGEVLTSSPALSFVLDRDTAEIVPVIHAAIGHVLLPGEDVHLSLGPAGSTLIARSQATEREEEERQAQLLNATRDAVHEARQHLEHLDLSDHLGVPPDQLLAANLAPKQTLAATPTFESNGFVYLTTNANELPVYYHALPKFASSGTYNDLAAETITTQRAELRVNAYGRVSVETSAGAERNSHVPGAHARWEFSFEGPERSHRLPPAPRLLKMGRANHALLALPYQVVPTHDGLTVRLVDIGDEYLPACVAAVNEHALALDVVDLTHPERRNILVLADDQLDRETIHARKVGETLLLQARDGTILLEPVRGPETREPELSAEEERVLLERAAAYEREIAERRREERESGREREGGLSR